MDKKLQVVYKNIDEIVPYVNNTKKHPQSQIDKIKASIKEFGMCNPILIHNNTIIAGHGRYEALRQLGYKEVPTIDLSHLSETQRKAYIIADNRIGEYAIWDNELLAIELSELDSIGFDLETIGIDSSELDEILEDFEVNSDIMKNEEKKYESIKLNEVFGMPPFSVLDTKKKEWQDRKREWKKLINDNGESRKATLFNENDDDVSKKLVNESNGVSILDPVMSELMVLWFSNKGYKVFDPFAGDSVFGFVSSYLGREFIGIELREEQVKHNQNRVDKFCLNAKYICDTSENMDKHIENNSMDLIFSCPPYADLEVYSDNPKDLSNMTHEDFFKTYKVILQNTFKKLKYNRFAIIVIGEVRGKDGNYIGIVPKTIEIMEEAGFKYYNELILVNVISTLAMRVAKQMKATRKIGKHHQNILVFLKGDSKKATENLGDIYFDEELFNIGGGE